MSPSVIVSYDGTDNDRDALALGRLFAAAGASVALAYVRHAAEEDHERERAAQADAEALLAEGAEALGGGDIPRHVVLSAATGAGLAALAESVGADAIVFGSDYRTAPGHVQPGTSAGHLLQGGPVAVAVAPAGVHNDGALAVRTIGEISEPGDWSARETAESLAGALGVEVAPSITSPLDLLVVGSQTAAVPGRVAISAAAQYVIETARCPVLVVPRGGRVLFTNSGS
jgi:nucleotide-binding universal stress UspA family protein